MRRIFLPILFASLTIPFITFAQSGQSPSSSSVPAKVEKGEKAAESKPADITVLPKPEEPKHDYSQEAFVVQQYRTIFHFESDGTGRRETVARIRVQSEAGVQQWGQIQVG